MNLLLCLMATIAVVPDPKKGSIIVSPSLVVGSIQFSTNFSGNEQTCCRDGGEGGHEGDYKTVNMQLNILHNNYT